MFIEQIIEFELKGPGSTGCTYNHKTGYSYDKTKISKVNFFNWLSNLKILVLSNGSKNVQNVIKMH